MRINEAYEHEPILPYQGEERCPPDQGCNRNGEQCVDVAALLTMFPVTEVGPATVTCHGAPCTVCRTSPDGSKCEVTITQKLCVSVPIHYSVEVDPGTPTIACSEEDCCCGGSCCGC